MNAHKRQVILDTETTGMSPEEGHRVIEIGCVEMIGRKITDRHFHVYLNPERVVDQGAIAVHGITNEFLADKPLFAEQAEAFLEFVEGAELIIHNASFDVGFLNHELKLLADKNGTPAVDITSQCSVVDSLKLARDKHPGQRNSLDALCRRYEVDNAHRTLHGALLDSQILAEVYLKMTGGQMAMMFNLDEQAVIESDSGSQTSTSGGWCPPEVVVIQASVEELNAH